MTGKESDKIPFKALGLQLQLVRQRVKETISEVAGAVEIDEPMLQRIEFGQERPAEDILLLLIRHFAISDDEAASLWNLAGYESPQNIRSHDDNTPGRPLVMVMAIDSRIIYSDKLEIVANQNGVVLNFLQAPDGPYQSQTVARIGMSLEQSNNMLKVLEQTLTQTKQAIKNSKNISSSNKKPKQNEVN